MPLNAYVLDACALIAYLEGEFGGHRVAEILLSGASVHMAAINLLEVCYDVQRTRGSLDAAREIVRTVLDLGIRIEWEVTESWLLAASDFKARGRISLGDAMALALSQELNALLVTADHHEFDPIEKEGRGRFMWIR